MTYDFDNIIDRKNTNSLKYDCAARRGRPEGLIPMWVADMDFQTAPEISDALKKTAEHGIYGYTEQPDDYFDVIRDWLRKRTGFLPEREWRIYTPGIVFSISEAIRAYTDVGDAVLIQPPVYYPFKQQILANKRELILNPLTLANGVYKMNLQDLEDKIKKHKVKLMILCSPHNPVGRVWTADELTALGAVLEKHGVIAVSDEIHSDFVYDGGHCCFLQVSEKHKYFSVVCTSPGKTFNAAGLQLADIWIADRGLRKKFLEEHARSGFSQLNTFGIFGAYAAYKYGGKWLDALIAYLKDNRSFISEFIKSRIPNIELIYPGI